MSITIEAAPRWGVADDDLYEVIDGKRVGTPPMAIYAVAKERPIPFTDDAWDVVPNLTIEIVSPSNGANELETKIGEYFRARVQLVWVVYPLHARIYVHQSPTQVHVLTITDELDGGKVVPGFRLPLAALFTQGVETNGTHS